MIPKDNRQLDKARSLRHDMTPQERRLWYTFLRSYPVKFYKQRIIDHYIVDFYCASAGLVLELDGSQHYEETGREYDLKRTQYLEALGLQVVRYSNADIDRRFASVCEEIDHLVKVRIQGKKKQG